MKTKAIIVPEGTFRSPLIRISAIFFLIAAGFAALTLISFPVGGTFFFQIAPDSTLDASGYTTWMIIHTAIKVFSLGCALLAGIGLITVSCGNVGKGTGIIERGLHILQIVLTVTSVIAAGYFLYRAAAVSLIYLRMEGGIIPLFSVLLAEALLAVQAAAIYFVLRRFIDALSLTAATAGYISVSGVIKGSSIPVLSSVGLLILGGVNVGLCVYNIILFIKWECALAVLLPVLMHLAAAVGCCLMGLYLRKYKSTSEYLLYKGTPVEQEEKTEEAEEA